MIDWFTVAVTVFAAIGCLLFGFDTGIATTTIAHDSWKTYMGHPDNGLTGAVVALYIAGEAIGSLLQTFLGDKMGRIRFMQLMCMVVTIGTAIQTASVNIAMFLAGRAIAGIAVGGMVGTVPTYLSEISPPRHRGLIGGTAGMGISFGAMLANWVGFFCSYAPNGQVQWRVPLSIQIPWGIIMFIGLATFMPDSPRHLVRVGQMDKAMKEFARTRQGQSEAEIEQEFAEMRAQILFEKEREGIPFKEVWRLYRRRIMVCIATQTMTSLTGVNVIQYYQTILYKSLGIDPKTILALAGLYGTCALIANVIAVRWSLDQWGRRPMLLYGLLSLILVEIYSAVMQRFFQDTDNKVGKGFAILGIYLFVVAYYGLVNSTTWLYGVEVLPTALRSKIMGVACTIHFIVNVGITQAGPAALANIHENYYYVFAGCTTFFLIIGYFFFKETKQKTLEEIAEAFGDKTVTTTERASAKLEDGEPAVEHAY